MSWFLRPKEDAEIYKPRECPEYSDADNFTIKLHHGGELKSDPLCYVGGTFDYFDFCNADEISLLDLIAMMKEIGDRGGCCYMYSYRLPGTTMDRGCFHLETDEDMLDMCGLVKGRYVDIFVSVMLPLSSSQPELNTQNIEYAEDDVRQPIAREEPFVFTQPEPDYRTFDFDQSTQDEIREEEEMRNLYGFEEGNSDGSEYVPDNIDGDDDVSDAETFYSDNSNKDHSDDQLIFEDNADKSEGNEDRVDDEVLFENGSEQSSIYADSEDERMAENSTDDEHTGGSQYHVYDEEKMKNPVFELGMCFKDAKTFRDAVKRHAILERRPIEASRNFGKKVQYVCQKPCRWRVYAAPLGRTSTYQIRTLIGKHTCMPTFKQKQINSTWLAQYYEKEIRMNPTWPINAFHQKIVNDLKCHVSKHAVYRAKTRALVKINGTHKEQYGLVWKYGHELKRVIPESTIKILTENPEPGVDRGRFMRMYICLGPIKKAFTAHCRKIVGLDGCHLKGPFGGQLLAAVGVDANEGMYPVAWAVVEAETTESWTWFLQLLCQDIRILVDREWTFISDRQKGLINALESVVPHAEHRFCVMHLFQNMHKEYKGVALRHLLWKAARASTQWEFKLHMNLMKELSSNCHDWLMQKPTSQWTRSAFRTTSSSDMFVNNHCEVFNSSIRKFRDLPILTMFRQIHIAVMKRIQIRRDKMKGMESTICPTAQKKLNKAIQFAGNCVVNWSGGSTYSVTFSDGGHELVVDLTKRICTCRKWDLTGIPCYHACACIAFKNDPWEQYITDWYKKDMYLKLYSHTLEPIVGPDFWEDAEEPMPLPPNVKTPTGRPKKRRNKTNDIPTDPTKFKRQNTTVNCTYCKAAGHNWRSCESRKNDEETNAAAEGIQLKVGKTKVKCGTCGQEGHNARTCKVKKTLSNGRDQGEQQQAQDKGKKKVRNEAEVQAKKDAAKNKSAKKDGATTRPAEKNNKKDGDTRRAP